MSTRQFPPVTIEVFNALCRLVDGGVKFGGLSCIGDAAAVFNFLQSAQEVPLKQEAPAAPPEAPVESCPPDVPKAD